MSSAQTSPSSPAVKTQRQMEKEMRREQLLAAAARLFADRGFAAVPLDEIGTEVGVTGQAIYRHFDSKQAMLGVLIGQASHHLLSRGREIEAECADTFERLQRLVALQTEFALSSSDIIRVQDRDLASVEDRIQRDIRRTQREFIAIWIRALQHIHPQETIDQLTVRAHAVFGLINSTGHSFRGLAKRKQTGNFLAYLKHMLPEMAMQALYAAPGEPEER